MFLPAAFLALVLLLVFPLAHAQAAFQLCRTDPIVTLSNGDIVSIYVDINADPVDVSSIEYTLHVPNGVTAVSIVYLGTDLGLDEHLTLMADGKKNEYKSETLVNVSKSTNVTATLVFGQQSVAVSGKGGQVLKATVNTNRNGDN